MLTYLADWLGVGSPAHFHLAIAYWIHLRDTGRVAGVELESILALYTVLLVVAIGIVDNTHRAEWYLSLAIG